MTCPPHHWQIAPANGPWSPGVCFACMSSRWFSNGYERGQGIWAPLDPPTSIGFSQSVRAGEALRLAIGYHLEPIE